MLPKYIPLTLYPGLHPDFISQPWRKVWVEACEIKSGWRPGYEVTYHSINCPADLLSQVYMCTCPSLQVVAPPSSEAPTLSSPATQKGGGGPRISKTAPSGHATPTMTSSSPAATTPKTGQPGHATPKSQPKAGSSGSSSKAVALRVKVTRSKVWLQQFASSDDPVKIYLAAVYDYREPNGEFVAETFHELPSAKVW